jgi:hypothetical protein
MGGNGSGGMRVGAGRKSKDQATAALHGSKGRVERAQSQPLPLEHVSIPGDLPAEQATVWAELAPHALAARTLTQATAGAFRDLCEAVVLKRALLKRIEFDGLTYQKVSVDGAGVEHVEVKAHPLLTQHRGMMQRTEAGYARFRLAPIGKEIAAAVADVDPFDSFDDGSVQ